MDTQIAYHEYLLTAQQNANYENTLLWIFFILVVIAPVVFALIYIPVAIISQPRCPKCRSVKVKAGTRVTQKGDTLTEEPIHICSQCKTEF